MCVYMGARERDDFCGRVKTDSQRNFVRMGGIEETESEREREKERVCSREPERERGERVCMCVRLCMYVFDSPTQEQQE